ncbi:MAG: hypothetical protein M9922_07165 [Microthrixaceae bacterium]|nr:hypothetical protein [Microthrixaceae bacterium]
MFGDEAHWYKKEYLSDGRVFDPAAPEFMVVADGSVVGAMFLAPSLEHTQQDPPGAPLVKWHYHEWRDSLCLEQGLVPVAAESRGECPAGTESSRFSPPMAHVWLIDITDPFATDMHAHDGH